MVRMLYALAIAFMALVACGLDPLGWVVGSLRHWLVWEFVGVCAVVATVLSYLL